MNVDEMCLGPARGIWQCVAGWPEAGISRPLVGLVWEGLCGDGAGIRRRIQDFAEIAASRLGPPYLRL